MLGTLAFACFIWIVLAGFYLLFAGQIDLTEIIAGLTATTIAACFAVLIHRERSRKLKLTAPWPHIVFGSLLALYPDAGRVGRVLLSVLWRQPTGGIGQISLQPFRQGSDNAADAGRRSLVTLAMSLAPNGYVLSISDGQDTLIMHRLAPAEPEPNREWPT